MATKYKKINQTNIRPKLEKRIIRKYGFQNEALLNSLSSLLMGFLAECDELYLAKDFGELLMFVKSTSSYLTFVNMNLTDNVYLARLKSIDNRDIFVCALNF